MRIEVAEKSIQSKFLVHRPTYRFIATAFALTVLFCSTANADPSLMGDIYDDLSEGSFVDFYGQIDDKLYYSTYEKGVGTRLWVVDSAGAREVKTDVTGNAIGSLRDLAFGPKPQQYGQHIFFEDEKKAYAIDASGVHALFEFEYEPWDDDNSYWGTFGKLGYLPFRGWDGTNLYIVEYTYSLDGHSIYTDHLNIWKTDGTATGTKKVARLDSEPHALAVAGDSIYYTKGFESGADFHATSLWRYDIATKTDKLLLEAPDISDRWIENLTVFNNALYFSTRTQSNGRELWKSDGTVKGTKQLADIHVGTKGSYPRDFQVFNNALYFSASDGDHGRQLWKTDGTTAGTVRISDMQNGGKGSVEQLTVLKNNLFFVAEDSAHGRELWKTDGTRSGTALVKDIYPGTTTSGIHTLFVGGENLYFFANDGTHGRELWTSNGSGSAQLIADLYPGAEGSEPRDANRWHPSSMLFANDILYFTAVDGVHGEAPWKYVPTQPPAGTAAMGDFVWRDDNDDGIQNSGEPGLANVKVDLQQCDGTVVKSTLTDKNGLFLFDKLAADQYRLKFNLPAGYKFSPAKSTDLYKLDSNANALTGLTECYDMQQGWQRLAIDAGMVPDKAVPAEALTIQKAIYYSATKTLWIRAQSDSKPAGKAVITASAKIGGVNKVLGQVPWKSAVGYYQKQFSNVASAPRSIKLVSDQGGVVTASVTIK